MQESLCGSTKPKSPPNRLQNGDGKREWVDGVAETCGTSTTQIEKTYYHTTEAKMIRNALPQFEYKDGLLVLK